MSSLQTKLVLAISLALSTIVSAESVIGKKYNSAEIAKQNIGNNYLAEFDNVGNVKQVIVTGKNGSGTDSVAVIKERPTTKSVVMPKSYQGQAAIDFLGADIKQVAETLKMDVESTKAELLNDSSLFVDEEGQLFYIDAEHVVTSSTEGSSKPVTTQLAPDVDVMKLHSRKDSKKTIYLDMDGETVESSAWSSNVLVADPFVRPDLIQYDYYKQQVYAIWSAVAEDYIGMDVDVTTEKPTVDKLLRNANVYNPDGSILNKDDEYGIHAVITNTYSIRALVCAQVGGRCGGSAYVGAIGNAGTLSRNVTWIFSDTTGSNHDIAEATAHEVGHTVGLLHDGLAATASSQAAGYYTGHDNWAPIMGVGYTKTITQFSKGEYTNANNLQDDFLVMASYGLVTIQDDIGDTKETATIFYTTGVLQSAGLLPIENYGVIASNTDIDMYVVNAKTGPMSLDVIGVGNLDPKATLLDTDGNVVAEGIGRDDKHWSYGLLQKNITVDVTEGTYYLKVESDVGLKPVGYSNGVINVRGVSYPTYGSVGQYSIKGTYAGVNYVSPIASITSDVTEGVAPLTVHFDASNSVVEGGVSTFVWNTDGMKNVNGQNITKTFNAAGEYNIYVYVTNEFGLTDSKTITLIVKAPEIPTIVTHIKTAKMTVVKSGQQIYYKTLITLVNGLNKPVKGAIISGKYTGIVDTSWDMVGVNVVSKVKTNAKGQVTLISTKTPYVHGTSNFEVADVSLVGYVYNPAVNVVGIQSLTRK